MCGIVGVKSNNKVASKLIKENPWITDRQEIIDNYYIQEISIKNPQKKGF